MQGDHLAPPQASERRDQDQRSEALRHLLGQREDLRNSEDRPLCGLLLAGTDNAHGLTLISSYSFAAFDLEEFQQSIAKATVSATFRNLVIKHMDAGRGLARAFIGCVRRWSPAQ
ncbi:hypothetical protein [Salinispora arenicola]|uniref:hypothetical protein n=1 Tax=Salinispora arenicola TaxID=168697 RepID=UPI00207AF89A|nr:hypothetical protein [Salinispora arenicola]MCN0154884.1 hypothetical protein [Salinispora arenicola]